MKDEIVVHSYRRCPFAIRVRMTLEEKGLAYRVIEENLSEPSTELLRHHPEGQVPVLLHKGQVLHESSIITEYLDDEFPNPPLRPASAQAKARIRLWTFWCDRYFKPDLDAFKYEYDSLESPEKEALLGRLKAHLAKLEETLESQVFLLGSELSLADLHVFPFYRQLLKARKDFDALLPPALRVKTDAWLERLTSRPSFDRVMAKKVSS